MKERTPSEILGLIAKILDELKIAYYITGGFAVSIWGKPRFTADIDLIVKMSHLAKKEFTSKVKAAFPKGYVDSDQIDTALAEKGEFNFIDSDTSMKVDFWIAQNNEFEKECFQNIRVKDIGYKVNFISPENLIISKLLWYQKTNSSRHLEDAKSVVENTKINKNYLRHWAIRLKLSSDLKKIF